MQRIYSIQFTPVQWRNVEVSIEKNIPEQKNGIDCGVFLCEYAENLARKSKFQFTQHDTKFIRERMKIEISLMALIQDPLNM